MKLFDQALLFATERHSGAKRKGADIPYILHPMEAATVVATMSDDEELLSAALLHDVVEDAGVTFPELREKFGDRVADLVAAETEEKNRSLPAEVTWCARKEASLAVLAGTDDPTVKMLWLGDKLSNMRSLARQYRAMGEKVWDLFHQKDPKQHEWYYRKIGDALSDLREYDAYIEYMTLVNSVFGNPDTHGNQKQNSL